MPQAKNYENFGLKFLAWKQLPLEDKVELAVAQTNPPKKATFLHKALEGAKRLPGLGQGG